MTTPLIDREETETGGRYVTVIGGARAEMTYSKAGQTRIIIDHTDVPDELRGQSVGLALVRRAVEDARAGGFKIIPLCPFAKATLQKHPEWADVVQ